MVGPLRIMNETISDSWKKLYWLIDWTTDPIFLLPFIFKVKFSKTSQGHAGHDWHEVLTSIKFWCMTCLLLLVCELEECLIIFIVAATPLLVYFMHILSRRLPKPDRLEKLPISCQVPTITINFQFNFCSEEELIIYSRTW